MKSLSALLAWTCVLLLMVSFSTGNAMAQAGDVVVHATTIDITHFTGTDKELGRCVKITPTH
jgi:hypothetical protein